MHQMPLARPVRPQSRFAPAPSLLAGVWLTGVAVAWLAVTRSQLAQAGMDDVLEAAGGAAAPSLGFLAFTSVLGRFFALSMEALFYSVWWRSLGARFRWGRFLVTIASLSLIDAWAETLQGLVRDHAPSLAAWLAPVLGLGLLRDRGVAGEPAWTMAFASLGLATAVRVTLTARAQAREIGRGIGLPLLLTAGVWFLSRVAVWWAMDLARGMSPLP